MSGSDNADAAIEKRNEILRDQMDYASARISDTVRYTALGQVGATYAVIVSNTPFSIGMMRDHSTLVFCVLIFGCAALVFDFLQYILTYARVVHLHAHPEEDVDRGRWHVTAWLTFWAKCFVALVGMTLLGWVIFSASYLAKSAVSAESSRVQTLQIRDEQY